MNNIFEVVSLSEPQSITRRDGSSGYKQTLVLRLPGGEHEDTFLCTHLGATPLHLDPGKFVLAKLRFAVSSAVMSGQASPDGQMRERLFQDIYIRTLRLLPALSPEASPAAVSSFPSAATPGSASPAGFPSSSCGHGLGSAPTYSTLPGIPIEAAAPF